MTCLVIVFCHCKGYCCYTGTAGIGFIFNAAFKCAHKITFGGGFNKVYVDAFLAVSIIISNCITFGINILVL